MLQQINLTNFHFWVVWNTGCLLSSSVKFFDFYSFIVMAFGVKCGPYLPFCICSSLLRTCILTGVGSTSQVAWHSGPHIQLLRFIFCDTLFTVWNWVRVREDEILNAWCTCCVMYLSASLAVESKPADDLFCLFWSNGYYAVLSAFVRVLGWRHLKPVPFAAELGLWCLQLDNFP